MDKIQKLLSALSDKDRRQLMGVLESIAQNKTTGLDLKKLRSRDDIYRVRKGKFRVLLLKTRNSWNVIAIERRSDTTYS